MEALHKGWFSELQHDLWPGQSFSLKVKRILHEEKSKFQEIKILETTHYGNALILDNIIQCTTRDEFAYQEMISFLPLCSHPDPKTVLIVGGGDGGVAREAVKHPSVQEVYQVEIDERVIELSKEYLPEMACGFENSKVHLHIGDGFEFMKQHTKKFDVIITDSSDPVGPAVSLFEENYFSLMKNALKADGIVCSQGGTYWTDLPHLKKTLQNCKKYFPLVKYAVSSVPSYPCGQIGYIIGNLNSHRPLEQPAKLFTNDEIDNMNLRYYSSDIHRSAFSLPRYVEKELYEK